MPQIPRADPGPVCPLHKRDVAEVCHTCPLWIQLRGKNHNNGQDIDEWGCSFRFLPVLLIENAAQTRGAAAATEDARNHIVAAFEMMAEPLASLVQRGDGAKLIAPVR